VLRLAHTPGVLAAEHALLTRLAPLAIPIALPTPLAHVASPDPGENPLAPAAYLLLARPAGRVVSASAHHASLAEVDAAALDLRLGALFRAAHAVDEEYFGAPDAPPDERALEWEDAFLLMLEGAIDGAGARVPAERVRALLARALGAFLFGGVEWPHLVLSPLADPLLVLAPERADVVGICPLGVPHALWGDPALEHALRVPTPPSRAFLLGYTGAEGDGAIVRARDRTKALWYRLYAALVQGGETMEEEVRECVRLLEDAPCY
jgi:hypothetical protein